MRILTAMKMVGGANHCYIAKYNTNVYGPFSLLRVP